MKNRAVAASLARTSACRKGPRPNEHAGVEVRTAPRPVLDAGLLLGRYRMGGRIGSGGFGTVYRARDERLQREVAVKVLPRSDDADDPRAEREARVAARLNHPAIVSLYEIGGDDIAMYLVSELVEGAPLSELIAEDRLSDRDIARIGAAMFEALAHAHEKGVIHRDVKPANILVVAEPAAGAGFAKLADFGVAHLVGDDPLTRTGDIVGTLAYMAPEQAEGERVSPASDVYSLALTLFEAWTGENPVRGRGPAATARKLGRPIPSLARWRRDLPRELADWIDAALDADPRERPEPLELAHVLSLAAKELSDDGGLSEEDDFATDGAGDAGAARTERLAGALAAGLLTGLALALLGPEPPLGPAAGGLAAGALVALAPRIGWVAAALGICAWLAMPLAAREGFSVLLLAAVAPVPFLLRRSPHLWCVPALAPALGAAGLAPAFAAVAAQAGTARRRVALALLGFWWTAIAELVSGARLLYGAPDGARPARFWDASVTGAIEDALVPVLSSPVLAVAALWAVAAVLLPIVVRGSSLALDAFAAAAWAAALVAAHRGLEGMLAVAVDHPLARGVVAGAVLGAVAAAALAATRARARDAVITPETYP